MPKKGIENLIPNEQRTPEERRKNAAKAGRASGESRRRSKALHDVLDKLLSKNLSPGVAGKLPQFVQQTAAQQDKPVNLYEAIALAQIYEAIKGDTDAAKFVRDSVGDKPVEKIAAAEVDVDIIAQVERLVLFGAGDVDADG